MSRLTTIEPHQARTLDGLFRLRVAASPDAVAYREFDRAARAWSASTWAQMAVRVGRWQAALAAEGLAPGERVALSLRNGRDWVCFDIAAASLGLVSVPLYADDRADNVRHIVEDAGVRLLLVQDVGRWRRLAPGLSAPCLQRILVLEGVPEGDARVRAVADWLPPEGTAAVGERPALADELATIVYTSGTTGRSKGVMLSHRNILENAHAGLSRFEVGPDDSLLSFLPLAHTLERTAGYYLPMMAGLPVAYARSVQQLAQDLLTHRPSLLIAVPRIFESVHARIARGLEEKSAMARRLYRWTVAVGWHRFERAQGRRRWGPGLLAWPLLHRLVARPVSARLGGRVRIAVSGGAALAPAIAHDFIALGVPIYQGYGLTESSPVISVNQPRDNDPASVGAPLPGVATRLGEHDELQVSGPNVMQGYWGNPEATAAVIGPDGWLRTGDQARIDAGRIYITGRLKDILVLSNGEKVPPADMEMAIGLDPLFDQAMVVGEGRSYLAVLAVVNAEAWRSLAAGLGLDPEQAPSLADRRVKRAALERIGRALAEFPGYAKVRRVHLLREPWTLDDDLITPTLKVKRFRVLQRYAAEVEAMYAE